MKSLLILTMFLCSLKAYSDYPYIPGPNKEQLNTIQNIANQYLSGDPNIRDAQILAEQIRRSRNAPPPTQTQVQVPAPVKPEKTFCVCTVNQKTSNNGRTFFIGNITTKTDSGRIVKSVPTDIIEQEDPWSNAEENAMIACQNTMTQTAECRNW